MLIGILSDTHDRRQAMAQAVALLQQRGAQFFLHCGDVGSPHMLDFLAGLPAAFVWGNNDYDRMGLQRYARELGIGCYGAFGELELAGKRFALMHGDDLRLKQRIIAAQQHDYLLLGHTHVSEDQRLGTVRIINPGALHRTNEKTVGLLDLESDRLDLLPVNI